MSLFPVALVLLSLPVPVSGGGAKVRPVVQTETAAALYRRVKPYVVTVKTSDGTGSGFITNEGLLYTSYHVVRASEDLKAVLGNGKSIPLKTVVAADPDNDWVCFQTSIKGNIRVAAHNKTPVGARVAVIGSPKGLTHTINEGLMSGRRVVDRQDLIQLSIPSSPGSSGSPVFNSAGEVIGIVAGGPDESTETITYAVPAIKFAGRRGVPASLVTKDFTSGEFGSFFQFVYDQLLEDQESQAKELKIVEDRDARRLRYLPTANLAISGVSEVQDLVDIANLTTVAKEALATACPRFGVVDDAEQDKRLKYWNEEFVPETGLDGLVSKLIGLDEYYRRIYIFLTLNPKESGYSVVANLTVERGGTSVVDEMVWDAYFVSDSLVIADKNEVKSAARTLIAKLIGQFAEKWNLANPKPKDEK